MQRIVPFPRNKERVLIANTFSPPVQTVTFQLDEQHVVVALQMPTFPAIQKVHLQLLCGEHVTTTHVYYAHAYFTEHFPHIQFSFCAQTSEAVVATHIIACCIHEA